MHLSNKKSIVYIRSIQPKNQPHAVLMALYMAFNGALKHHSTEKEINDLVHSKPDLSEDYYEIFGVNK